MQVQSTINVTANGGVTYTGPKAVDLFRAKTTLQALKLYKIGVSPARSVSKTTVMQIAGKYTGKTYKRGQIDAAIQDMEAYVAAETARWVPAEKESV